MKLYIAGGARRDLELCRVEEEPRHLESDLPVQRVIGSACEDARTRAILVRGRADGDARRVDLHTCHARAPIDRHASRRRALEQILIELPAIDDDRFDAWAGIHDFVT